jgi:serine/threonine protein kinase
MFLRELSLHENVVKLHSLIRAQNPNDLYLIFEFLETDLHQVIRGGILEEVHKQFILYQILKALKYIHSANIIHRGTLLSLFKLGPAFEGHLFPIFRSLTCRPETVQYPSQCRLSREDCRLRFGPSGFS